MQAQSILILSDAQQVKPSFIGIVRSELVKITWLRSTWIMTALVITLMAAFSFLTATEGHLLLQRNPVEYAREYILNQDFKIFQALTGYFVLLITVFAVGLDYQFGTIRVILGRGVGRVQFLLGKIVALFIFAILILVGGVVLNSILLATVVSIWTGSLTAMSTILSHVSGIFAQYFLFLLFNMWVSILLAICATVVGRSLTFGMVVALIWFPFDNIASTLLELGHNLLPGDILLKLSFYLLGPNLNILPQFIVTQKGTSPANESVLYPIVVALVYACVFLVVSLMLTQRRDVQA